MKPSTPEAKARHTLQIRQALYPLSFTHMYDCVFEVFGRYYDFSAADPDKAIEIARDPNHTFMLKEEPLCSVLAITPRGEFQSGLMPMYEAKEFLKNLSNLTCAHVGTHYMTEEMIKQSVFKLTPWYL